MYALLAYSRQNAFTDALLGWMMAVTFTVTGLYCLIAALTGWSKVYEDSKNPAMQQQLEKLGKGKARVLHGAVGAVVLAIGIWLLHGLLFIPQ